MTTIVREESSSGDTVSFKEQDILYMITQQVMSNYASENQNLYSKATLRH